MSGRCSNCLYGAHEFCLGHCECTNGPACGPTRKPWRPERSDAAELTEGLFTPWSDTYRKDAESEVRVRSDSGGEKGRKPERYDLIPVEPLAEVARLYGAGAEKYTRRGTCSCAAIIVQHMPTIAADRATRESFDKVIRNMPNGSDKTAVVGALRILNASGPTTSNEATRPQGSGAVEHMDSPPSSTKQSSPNRAASVERPRESGTLTTITPPGESEVPSVTDAISVLGSWSDDPPPGFMQHLPGCPALTIVSGDRNWELGYDWALSYAALSRHLNQFWGGESFDPETGRHHLSAVIFHAMALMEFERRGIGTDTRSGGRASGADGTVRALRGIDHSGR